MLGLIADCGAIAYFTCVHETHGHDGPERRRIRDYIRGRMDELQQQIAPLRNRAKSALDEALEGACDRLRRVVSSRKAAIVEAHSPPSVYAGDDAAAQVLCSWAHAEAFARWVEVNRDKPPAAFKALLNK